MNAYFFYLLGVGLPCRWIFCQFWLCEEVQCVYLRRHLGSLPIITFSTGFLSLALLLLLLVPYYTDIITFNVVLNFP